MTRVIFFFLAVIAIIIGYFALTFIIVAKAKNKKATVTIALFTLAVYASTLILLWLFIRTFDTMGLALFALIAIYACVMVVYGICCVKTAIKKINYSILITLTIYLLAVAYITVFSRTEGSNYTLQMEIGHVFSSTTTNNVQHALMNVAMFGPIGFLFPLVFGGNNVHWWGTIGFGSLVSVIIETTQAIYHSGICDIDDVISNIIGALIGYFLFYIILKVTEK